MHRPATFRPSTATMLAASGLALVLTALPAAAQMLDRPWSFSQTNRASIAFSMRDRDNAAAGAFAPGPTIVCGGGGSTAAGNNTCIVLNNATGQIALDQLSDGSQDANNEQTNTATWGDPTTTTSDGSAASDSGAEQVLDILGQ